MATKPTRRKKTTAPEPEVTETTEDEEDAFEELESEDEDVEETDGDIEDEDDDLEELEEDEAPEEEEPEPTTTKRKAKATKSTGKTTIKKAVDVPAFGSTQLAAHITEATGQSYDARSVRVLLRRVAKDPNGPLKREIGAERTRYSFSGPDDPTVKAIVAMVKSGEAQKIKQEGLDSVKKKAAAKKAAAKAAAPAEDEAPKRKAKATKAAPAKATATKKRRSS